MSRQRGLHRQTSRQVGVALAAVLTALLLASPAAATTRARSSPTGAASAGAWCALVIQLNTKYGTMKNKRYLPADKVPLSAWKAVIDAGLAGRSHLLAVTPGSIKKAMTDELAYFARVKANHYAQATPLGQFTVAEVTQLVNFQRKMCGITFTP